MSLFRKRSIALLLVSCLLCPSSCGAWVVSCPPFQIGAIPCNIINNFRHNTKKQPQTIINALVYGGVEEGHYSSSTLEDQTGRLKPKPLPWEVEEDQAYTSTTITDNSPSNLSSSPVIQQNLPTSSLARLAVAFSPPGHQLKLENIEHVEVIGIDSNHMEIEAVVCEDESCLTIFVPVTFPHECGDANSSNDMEECVLDNIFELQNMAEGKIVELNDQEIQVCLDSDPEASLWGNSDAETIMEATGYQRECSYPSWWVHPAYFLDHIESEAFLYECSNIKSLLNSDDFQQDVVLLARRGLEEILLEGDDETVYKVEKAVVVDVGPAGIYLRARAVTLDGDFHESDSELSEEEETTLRKRSIVEVSCPFGGEPALDAEKLRAAVLGIVTLVSQ